MPSQAQKSRKDAAHKRPYHTLPPPVASAAATVEFEGAKSRRNLKRSPAHSPLPRTILFNGSTMAGQEYIPAHHFLLFSK